jgi:hypothetical protein
VSDDYEELWAALPEKALHPLRVPILEALRWIGEPLSAVGLVDVFNGRHITMGVAGHHLRLLERLGVVEAYPAERDPHARRDLFYLPYRLTILDAGDGG